MEELLGGKAYALLARPDQQPLYELKYVLIVVTFLTGAYWGIKNVVV